MIFLYKTTNLLDGKFYIGVHDGEPDDDYLGSGVMLQRAIKKYGVENFRREVLREFSTVEEAYAAEREVVTPSLVDSAMCYNLNVGGRGGWYHARRFGADNCMSRREVVVTVQAGIRAALTDAERAARSERLRANRANGIVVKPSGWKHTEAAKQKMSAALTGKPAPNKGRTMPPDTRETQANKAAAAKIRAATMDMGALTRGKVRSPKCSCTRCRKIMYVKQFATHERGRCWSKS